MIAHLHGTVAARDASTVVVDVRGVGYLAHVVPGEQMPARGEPVELHTSLQVREESMTLYGFRERSSLVLFELLLTSSGVGPKLALAALGTHRPDVLRTAIAGGDLATLAEVPGVGKKVAERLVLELKDKVGTIEVRPMSATTSPSPGPDAEPDTLAEVRDALLGLGYSAGEVRDAVAGLSVEPGATTQQLLREALRTIGSGALDGAAR